MAFLVKIELETKEPVLFPKSRQQGNHFPGLDYIPGSAIRGALAGAMVAAGKEQLISKLIGHGLLISNFHTHNTLPIPLTLMRCKRDIAGTPHKRINIALTPDDYDPCDYCKGPMVNKPGYIYFMEKGISYSKSDGSTRLVTHNRIDPESGTSSGKSGKNDGANLYSAEVLELGQKFIGYLSWPTRQSRDELLGLDGILSQGHSFMLGKMKGRGYGRCEMKLVSTCDDSTIGSEIRNSCGIELKSEITSFTVLQDAIFLDDFVQNSVLPRTSDIPGITIQPNGAWSSFRTVHGFNMKRGVLNPPETSVVAGSTYLTSPFSFEAAHKLEENGVGARRCDGFGVVICGLAEALNAEEVWK